MTNKQLVTQWAKGNVQDGTTSNKTIIVKQGVIYSYGDHFIIAKFTNSGAVVTNRKYSTTTSKHVSLVRNALNSENVSTTTESL